MNWLLVRIMWNRQSKWHFFVAGAGLLLGMFILLFSLQMYLDIREAFFTSDPSAAQHVIIHKKPYQPSFSQEEIDTIRQQPFIYDAAAFQTSLFKMEADLPIDASMNDFLFLESIPTEFLDTVPENFKWEEESNFIPVIVSSFYINLYNLSIAGSQNLPQIPQEMIQMMPFEITIVGDSASRKFRAQAVAFSDRVPTVIVPYDFMLWANEKYGTKKDPGAKKLMLKVEDTGEDAFVSFLASKDYQVNQEMISKNKAKQLLNVVISILGVIGVLFMILSFVLFILSFQLIIAQAKQEVSMLMDIGYTWGKLSGLLNMQFAGIIAIVLGSVVGAILFSRNWVGRLAIEKGFDIQQGSMSVELPLLGGIILVILLLLNYWSLRSTLKR